MKYRSALCGAAALVLLNGCSLRSGLPIYGQVPEFSLVRETGQPFNQTDTASHVWVANFIFTTCVGPCPRLSAKMADLQRDVETKPDVLLVSMTIDPDMDSPRVLTQYARRFKARPGRWFFLTGEKSELRKLSKETFFLGDIGPPFEHSTRMVLIDKQGRVRGFYDSNDPAALADLRKHIDALRDERI